MVIISFAPKSSKYLPNIICRHFKHCAVIARDGEDFTMYQFVRCGVVEKIALRRRDIGILGSHGWRFVYVPCELPRNFPHRTLTCVGLAKRAIHLHAPMVLTPDALYRRISD